MPGGTPWQRPDFHQRSRWLRGGGLLPRERLRIREAGQRNPRRLADPGVKSSGWPIPPSAIMARPAAPVQTPEQSGVYSVLLLTSPFTPWGAIKVRIVRPDEFRQRW